MSQIPHLEILRRTSLLLTFALTALDVEYARAHRNVVKVAGPNAPVLAVPLVVTNVLLLSNAGITFAVSVPINNRFTRSSDEPPPEDWEKLRDRWLAEHNVRTIAQGVGLFMLLVGLMKPDGNTTERN